MDGKILIMKICNSVGFYEKEETVMRVVNLENENRKFVKSVDNFHVLVYTGYQRIPYECDK